jgi:hypothetical protein
MDDKERGRYIRRHPEANLAVFAWGNLVGRMLDELDSLTSQDVPRVRELVELGQLIADAKRGQARNRAWDPVDHTELVANLDAYADELEALGESLDRELGGR